MWKLAICILSTASFALAGQGYFYTPPFIIKPAEPTGHFFPAISTVSPLPAVPDLPPLPTGKPNVHSLVQVHPQFTPARNPVPVLRPVYGPPTASPVVSTLSRITQSYLPINQFNYGQPQQVPTAPTYRPSTGVGYPSGDEGFYLSNGRAVKQYAVFEVIDNDIEMPEKPFLTTNFFNEMRARIGGSGIGATAFSGAPDNQYQGRANALLLEQQRIAQQLQPKAAAGDTINIGSGGLGYIRLPNGNVYLGSGSLGYISGEEHNQSVLEARTRAEINSPDALHFGHGRNSNFK